MIIIETKDGHQHYVATKKYIPGIIQELKGTEKLETFIEGSRYFEFTITDKKTGKIGPFKRLSNLLEVTCTLVSPESPFDEEEDSIK